jgi:KUP system potassium uptake protein
MSEDEDVVPVEMLHQLKHNQVLHERVVLLTLLTEEVPRVHLVNHFSIEKLPLGFINIVARFGYMEEPHVPSTLALAARLAEIEPFDLLSTTYFIGHQSFVQQRYRHLKWRGWLHRRSRGLFILLSRNEHSAIARLGLPPNRVIEVGHQLEME